MPQRVLGLLLIIACVTAVNWCILRMWWRAITANNRWIFLFPFALPLVLFVPMYVVRSAELWALPTETGWQRLVTMMLWLLPTLVASYIGAQKYHHSRSLSSHKSQCDTKRLTNR